MRFEQKFKDYRIASRHFDLNFDGKIEFQEFSSFGNWINNKDIKSSTNNIIEVVSPYYDKKIASIPDSTSKDLQNAVDSAEDSFPLWSKTNIRDRAQIMLRFKSIIENDIDNLATIIALDNGKTIEDAIGSIKRGVEVIDFAISMPNILKGESSEVSPGINCVMTHEPLGVVAGITPFNFPVMVPLWMIPLAITAGNCFILKPSEQTPLAAIKLAEYLEQAGLPKGVFNVVHGSKDIVEAICDNSKIKAVAFVGSSKVAEIVYSRSAQKKKRAICLGGAKNHMIVVPDADVNSTAKGLLASSMGSAGQRCMAASVAVGVDNIDHIIDQLIKEANQFKLGIDMGTIISKASLDRITNYINEAEKMGAKILLDGRNTQSPSKYESGYWIGPTILDYVNPDWACATDEIFGPVLSIIRVPTIEKAMEIENNSQYGNAAAVFTTSGEIAKIVSDSASSGMIGINIGVPVPRDPFSFGGWNESKYGHGDITGVSGVNFWTNLKKTTSRWPESSQEWKKYF